jgi:carbon monoxide dehydrogenase subunit G
MASIHKEILTRATPAQVWDALRDVGALHTRLVPGFVVDTKLLPGERVVTFRNGMVIHEPIVDIDDRAMRVVWAAKGEPLTHYNGSAQVFADGAGAKVVWIADLLPNEAAPAVEAMMNEGMVAMKTALDRLAAT